MTIIFWFSLFWIFYAYAGYFLLLIVLTKFKKERLYQDEKFLPSLSLIVAAYNEEKVIRRKIEESLVLEYPKDKLEIIIASDASVDTTDSIVKEFSKNGVILIRQNERKGKTAVQNLAVSKAKGDVLVFSDATTVFNKDVLKKLSRHFVDFRVGCVGGEEHFIKSGWEISEEASFFWKYETLIRQKESDFNTMIGVSGCIFAIRKELYEVLDEGLIEDFALPLKIAAKGLRTVYEKEAIAYERAVSDTMAELVRKTRIVSGGINVLWRMRALLNPVKYPLLSFQVISHKICRWLASIFIILFFISNLFLMYFGTGFFILGVFQILFYLTAALAYFLKKYKPLPKALRLIYHFCVINFAAIFGIARFICGEKKAAWEPIR
jgi:cellulose synthase/poly-beta-1,6-N-acetylglucosamine synthase-like glycosyltransferase